MPTYVVHPRTGVLVPKPVYLSLLNARPDLATDMVKHAARIERWLSGAQEEGTSRVTVIKGGKA